MLFNSKEFLIFFPVVTVLYFVLPKRVKHLWLLAASYYFYMCWNARYALLLLFSTVVTYAAGLVIGRVNASALAEPVKRRRRKLAVAISFVLNLAILFFFKYYGFATGLLARVFARAGIALSLPSFDVLLPVGISFYTFQALGYTVDVYRGGRSERNFFRYALFVSFFPQLVAGPIERSSHLLAELGSPKPFDLDRARDGFLSMLWGFFLKLVLADRIAIFVDAIYGDPASFPGWYLIAATVLFAFQIYCDFAGYSTIAIGAAKILGIDLMENFDAPYLSGSVAAFWRRWHISLTSWFRDYLYIPLGGSRKGSVRKYLNKLIVFLVSGLWHGANLTFVVWGGLNGLWQVLGELLAPVRGKLAAIFQIRRDSLGAAFVRVPLTFALVDFTWIFFRAQSLGDAAAIIRSIFTVHNPWILFDGSILTCAMSEKNFRLMLLCLAILFFADLCRRRGVRVREVILRQNAWCRWLVMIAAICFILIFGIWGSGYDTAGFLYFQF